MTIAAQPQAATSTFWKTLGFVGNTFPLAYARHASFAARTAQALLDPQTAKLQLYVDAPALAMVGTEQWSLAEGSIPILWWLVLGISLSWGKGSFTESGQSGHDWIGVCYNFGLDGPTMELPRPYLEQAFELLTPLCASKGSIGVKLVHTALGKAARIWYVVPDSRPISRPYGQGTKQDVSRQTRREQAPRSTTYLQDVSLQQRCGSGRFTRSAGSGRRRGDSTE